MYIYNNIIYTYQLHIDVLKVKSAPGISTSKNLFKEIESVNKNTPGRSTRFEQMLVGWDELFSEIWMN